MRIKVIWSQALSNQKSICMNFLRDLEYWKIKLQNNYNAKKIFKAHNIDILIAKELIRCLFFTWEFKTQCY